MESRLHIREPASSISGWVNLLTRLRGPEPEVKDQDPRSSEALRDMVAKTTETLDKCSELLNCIENLI